MKKHLNVRPFAPLGWLLVLVVLLAACTTPPVISEPTNPVTLVGPFEQRADGTYIRTVSENQLTITGSQDGSVTRLRYKLNENEEQWVDAVIGASDFSFPVNGLNEGPNTLALRVDGDNGSVTLIVIVIIYDPGTGTQPVVNPDPNPREMVALTEGNTLVFFNSGTPQETDMLPVTGVDGALLGIDIRPADGQLYGFSSTNKIYTIDLGSGVATEKSTLSTTFTGRARGGVDFNPVPDRLRLTGSNNQNLRVNVDTGDTIVDGTLAYNAGDTNEGLSPNITASAYTNAFAGTETTQLFNIDATLNILVLQAPPNDGGLITIGTLGIDFAAIGGFDIVTDQTRNTNTAYAISDSNLYTIDLATGSATVRGTVRGGPFQGLAVIPDQQDNGEISFTSELAGDNEVPAVATTASGTVTATLQGSQLTVTGSFMGLESDLAFEAFGNAGPGHIHLGAADENGPVIFPLEIMTDNNRDGTFNLTTELSNEQIDDFKAGLFYVNLHTTSNPSGELRAQLSADAPSFDPISASFTAALSTVNEVPPVTTESDASGMARAILRGNAVIVSGRFMGLVSNLFDIGDAGPAHVHVGAVGDTGPVVLVLEVISEDRRAGRFGVADTLPDAGVVAMTENGYYVNIHTEANQPGEIRGQLFLDTEAVNAATTLSGTAEVPPVMTNASGEVRATLDGFNFILEGRFKGLESNLSDAFGAAGPAHLHSGAADENGPVEFPLEVYSADERSGMLSLEATFNDFQKSAFLHGLLYVNVHTKKNQGGEIRGQLEPEGVSTSVRFVPLPTGQSDSDHHHHHH